MLLHLFTFLSRRAVLPLTGFAAFCLLLFYHHDQVVDKTGHDTIVDVYNSTLGFQKVFAIGFKSRTDKHDAVTLASSFTGFDVEWSDGVSSEDVPKKAAPYVKSNPEFQSRQRHLVHGADTSRQTWNFTEQTPSALGCWRAHMNVLERIVAERIQSALVMEDDTDWSIYLKPQLSEFAHGARALQNSPKSSHSPYGHDWDFLWLGHCRVGCTDDTQKLWVIDDDFTVPPHGQRHADWRQGHVPDELRRNDTRLVLKANGGMCMYGYAITYDGARKILTAMSLQSRNQPVDVSMSAMCRQKFGGPFTCYAPYPPLLATHRAAGSTSRDSDVKVKADTFHPEYTWDIVYSTIQNIPRLLMGAQTVRAQWPDVRYPEAVYDETERPPPKGYLKMFDFKSMEKTQ